MRRPYLFLAIARIPCVAAATDFGTISIDGKPSPLTNVIAYTPYFDLHGEGKADTVVVLSNIAFDEDALGWISVPRHCRVYAEDKRQ